MVVMSVESKSRSVNRFSGCSALIVQSDKSVKLASRCSKCAKLDSWFQVSLCSCTCVHCQNVAADACWHACR